MRTGVIVLVGAFLLMGACGGEDGAVTTTSTSGATPSTTNTAPSTSTSTLPSTTTTNLATTTTRPNEVFFEGGVVTGPERVTATVGDHVSVLVLSDVDGEIHVHGYDLFFDATAGVPVEVALTADVPGIFEVEMEGSHTLLFDLEVTG